jgi:RND family efflux transporter MFP subunit
LIAPFDGTVAAVNTFVGQTTASGTTAITLVNTADLEIVVALSEVDVAQVKPGQEVLLTFDALSGKTYPGQVSAVSPLGTSSQGVVNYNVTVRLTNPDPAILPGMTASASIITQRVADALIAPNRAVRTQGNRRLMTLLFEGREIALAVQTGLTSEAGTQILSAAMADGQAVELQEGDTVLLNTTTTNTNQGGFFGPGAGGFAVPVR